ncbi:MAG: type I-E CRISPR-associated protein Cse2/CasB [Firmicutes bacterium ZCTH02-B6]|nr:MAG: type I-E CRISPR-associated protein Cse2/CasB [Firmicutes bacterium ZCTH02-B6]
MTTATITSSFIEWLQELVKKQDRARLAALRRGMLLEPSQFYELFSLVPPRFLEGATTKELQIRLMVAILFASHQGSFPAEENAGRRRNLGASLRLLALKKAGGNLEPDKELPEALKRRLDALLAARSEDLFHHLRQVIRLLKSEEIPVDWEQLLLDLRHWDREDRRVQWNWSRSFYVGERAERDESDNDGDGFTSDEHSQEG